MNMVDAYARVTRSLGVCFTSLDAAQIGDNVTCTVFSNQ